MGKPLAECSIEELKAKAKLPKVILCIFPGLILVFIGLIVYLLANGKEVNVGVMIPVGVCIFAGMIPSLSILGAIKKEIAKKEAEG